MQMIQRHIILTKTWNHSVLHVNCSILLEWFDNNFFKLNADNCKLLVTYGIFIIIVGENIIGEKSAKLLGIKIDNSFHLMNISKICTSDDQG